MTDNGRSGQQVAGHPAHEELDATTRSAYERFLSAEDPRDRYDAAMDAHQAMTAMQQGLQSSGAWKGPDRESISNGLDDAAVGAAEAVADLDKTAPGWDRDLDAAGRARLESLTGYLAAPEHWAARELAPAAAQGRAADWAPVGPQSGLYVRQPLAQLEAG